MNISYFKVAHLNNACLGIATMRNDRVTYKTNPKSYAWFAQRNDNWLRDFRSIVRRLCKKVGHNGTWPVAEDAVSGIRVERI